MAAIKEFQQAEINDHVTYTEISKRLKNEDDAKKIRILAADELIHARFWEEYTGVVAKPQKLKIWFFVFLSKLLGYTFVIKKLEENEERTIQNYKSLEGVVPGVDRLIRDEEQHEMSLISVLDEQHLQYTGSIVLGLNDALVELSGTLAGLTLAFQNTRMIALSGLVTGIAAALSMAASEYLSTKAEKTKKEPVKASIYTGIAYIVTVVLLILPYLIISNYFIALAVMMTTVFAIIAFFSFYMSVLKDEKFSQNFVSMAAISIGVALVSFLFGYLIKNFIEL
jgi:VIT1/CCC1 family predicted Fe2+/Mn2+ transporter